MESDEFLDFGKFKIQDATPYPAMIEPDTGQQLYSLRVTGSARAMTCLLSGPTLVLVSLHVQHDKAYHKR